MIYGMSEYNEMIDEDSHADVEGTAELSDTYCENEPSEARADPLLEGLVFIANSEQLHCTKASLLAGMPLIDGRMTPEIFTRSALRIGLIADVVERKLLEVSPLVLPAVLILKDNDAVVLCSIDNDLGMADIYVAAENKQSQISMTDLAAKYSGMAIYCMPEPSFDDRIDKPTKEYGGHWFWRVIFGSSKIYRDVLVASFFINLFVLANPLFVMNVYDRVVPNNAVETLWALAIGVLVLYVFDLILKSLRVYFIEVAGKKSDILLSTFIFERVLNAKFESHPQSVGAFASQFRDFETIRNFVTSATVTAFVDVPFVVLFLIALFYIGGPLVWVPVIAMPFIIIFSLVVERYLKRYVEHSFSASSQKSATLIEALSSLETIKILQAEGAVLRLWERSVGQLAFWGLKSRVISSSSSTFAGFIQQLTGVFVVIVGVYLISENELTQGALIASVILSGRVLGPLAQVSGLLIQYYQSKLALDSLDAIVNKPQERSRDKKYLQRSTMQGSIEFKGVSFSYPNDDQLTLSNVSFKVVAGEKIAVIGRIGSGKSTLQKLLLGLYSPKSGNILVDGVDISQLDPANLRANIGCVPQESVLFFGSIRDNIHYGKPTFDDSELLRVSEIAGIQSFVNKHPHGFERNVGERGELLSGGQRQSITIARALLNEPPIYLFDELTNAMDNTTEARFLERIRPVLVDKTLLLVTHKMSLLSLVDRVIVIDSGRIVADGARDSVIEALKKGQLNVS